MKKNWLFLFSGWLLSLLLLSVIRLPLPEMLIDTFFEPLLTTERYITTFENLTIGYLAAFAFYILNDYLPKQQRVKKVTLILNSCLASVIDSYKYRRIFGHEVAIKNVNTDCLNVAYLSDECASLKKNKTDLLKLKFGLDTAHTRHNDFVNLLQLASELSPERALQWLVIVDKIRLLSESYGQLPEVPEEVAHLVPSRRDQSVVNDYYKDLEFRIGELFSEAISWLEME